MANLNRIHLIGRVGRDAELRYSADGKPSMSFSMAVDGWGRPAIATWFNVKMFGQRTEKLSQYISKGASLYVEGRHESREYEGKNGKGVAWEVIASDIQLFSGQEQPRADSRREDVDDDDLPFE